MEDATCTASDENVLEPSKSELPNETEVQTSLIAEDNLSEGKNSIDTQDTNDANGNHDDNERKKGDHLPQRSSIRLALRKSIRTKTKPKSNVKSFATKGKSRRIIFKRNVNRSSLEFVSPVTSDSIYYNGTFFQKGDIVSFLDVEGGTYFAQLTGFLQDQFCEKSATVQWLLPSTHSKDGVFDVSTYVLGPEEDIPRKMAAMEFVMHAPSDYYKSRSPYPTVCSKNSGFIWTHLGPKVMSKDELDKF
ncbi:GATA zinc finger domain-containing protein 1 [Halotydeus destructor]|nr:GATA zinc finger domain-containing protein 1 [Halotydeus destructor]